jgi:hypothetical protein
MTNARLPYPRVPSAASSKPNLPDPDSTIPSDDYQKPRRVDPLSGPATVSAPSLSNVEQRSRILVGH